MNLKITAKRKTFTYRTAIAIINIIIICVCVYAVLIHCIQSINAELKIFGFVWPYWKKHRSRHCRRSPSPPPFIYKLGLLLFNFDLSLDAYRRIYARWGVALRVNEKPKLNTLIRWNSYVPFFLFANVLNKFVHFDEIMVGSWNICHGQKRGKHRLKQKKNACSHLHLRKFDKNFLVTQVGVVGEIWSNMDDCHVSVLCADKVFLYIRIFKKKKKNQINSM